MGFTLIELSIVLVILGLIVGGIVGGQALVKQARLQTVIRDWKGHQTALNAFRLQYDYLPGDFPDGWEYWDDGTDNICGNNGNDIYACNGNGDGILGTPINSGIPETLRAWRHMELAEIIPPFISGYNWSNGGARYHSAVTRPNVVGDDNRGSGITVPVSDYREGSGFVLFSPYMGSEWNASRQAYGKPGNWIMLFYPTGGKSGANMSMFGWSASTGAQASATPADAASLDKKLDDGKPATGNVIASRWWTNSNQGNCTNPNIPPWELDEATNLTSVEYLLSNTGYACNPMLYYGD